MNNSVKARLLAIMAVFFVTTACQMTPTKIVTEVASNGQDKNLIIADTRNSLDFSSYSLSGSVNLQSSDFLILKDSVSKKRILDPDLAQLIERLAKRGINPEKRVVLIVDEKNSVEGQKWTWLLKKIGINDTSVRTLSQYIDQNRPLRNRAFPDRVGVWTIDNKEEILGQADDCFVSYREDRCPIN